MTELRAGRFFDGERLTGPTTIRFEQGRVIEITSAPISTLSAAERSLLITPGFVDIQINGFGETSFATCSPTEFEDSLVSIPTTGVTTVLPTFPSRPDDEQLQSASRLRRVRWRPGIARAPGFHLEGPFLSPSRKGAHPVEALRNPSAAAVDAILAASSPIRLVTLAPELPGATQAIARLTAAGITVAVGHSAADFDTAMQAFAAGATVVTHLHNAQSPLTAREPGVVGAALADAGATLGLIADFVHVHPAVCAITFAAAGQRIALVTDQSAHPPGTDPTPRLADGTLAGSALRFDQAIRNLRSIGIDEGTILRAATSTPARAIGDPRAGRLAVGADADLVVLDEDWNVCETYVGGERSVLSR